MAAVRALAIALFAASALAAEPWEAFFDPFLGDLRAELAEAKSANKTGVVVMYHFEECPYCARMKREVLNRPEVQKAFHRDFGVIAIDTKGAQTITAPDGSVLKERDFAQAMGVRRTPTFDFIGPDGTRLYRHAGGIYDPAEFLLLGQYVASGAYRTLTFTQFKLKGQGT